MKKITAIVALLFCVSLGFAQKEKVRNGKFKALKGITAYNLTFTYDNVEIPKFDSEKEFLDEKVKEKEEDEAGAGIAWKEEWFSNRPNHFEPKFIESFNKRFDDNLVTVKKEAPERKYTINVAITMMYDGYNVGVWRKDAKLESTITVFETNNPSNILLEVDYSKVKGRGAMGYDFTSTHRVTEAYAKLAKEFAKKIRKRAF